MFRALITVLILLSELSGCVAEGTPEAGVGESIGAGTDTVGTATSSSAPTMPEELGPQGAAAVIRRYYDAIRQHEYEQAYGYWSGDGAASGQTFDEFRSGYAETAAVAVEVGTPGRVGAAAGSRYIEVPVTITAVTTAGERQRFEGEYTLRRSVVDGATAEQRQWRIYSAEIRQIG